MKILAIARSSYWPLAALLLLGADLCRASQPAFFPVDDVGFRIHERDVERASCIQQPLAGLIWERKQRSGPRSWDSRFLWFDPAAGDSREETGVPGTSQWRCGMQQCDTAAYLEHIRDIELCGRDDWRLPTREELVALSLSDSTYQFPLDWLLPSGIETECRPPCRERAALYFWTAYKGDPDAPHIGRFFNARRGATQPTVKATPVSVLVVAGRGLSEDSGQRTEPAANQRPRRQSGISSGQSTRVGAASAAPNTSSAAEDRWLKGLGEEEPSRLTHLVELEGKRKLVGPENVLSDWFVAANLSPDDDIAEIRLFLVTPLDAIPDSVFYAVDGIEDLQYELNSNAFLESGGRAVFIVEFLDEGWIFDDQLIGYKVEIESASRQREPFWQRARLIVHAGTGERDDWAQQTETELTFETRADFDAFARGAAMVYPVPIEIMDAGYVRTNYYVLPSRSESGLRSLGLGMNSAQIRVPLDTETTLSQQDSRLDRNDDYLLDGPVSRLSKLPTLMNLMPPGDPLGVPFGAQMLDLPADIEGSLLNAEDVDCYAFRAPNPKGGRVNLLATSESVNLIGDIYSTGGGHIETVDAWFSHKIEHEMLLGPTGIGRLCIRSDDERPGEYHLSVE